MNDQLKEVIEDPSHLDVFEQDQCSFSGLDCSNCYYFQFKSKDCVEHILEDYKEHIKKEKIKAILE